MEYLLWIQSFRDATGGAWDGLFLFLSDFAVSVVCFLVPAMLFWCVNKKAGVYLMMTYCVGAGLNLFLKNTACVIRPWIQDARLHPVSEALRTATGYSFPSGHSQIATALYGGLAVLYWRERMFAVVCIAMVLLCGFSRNYLGVHYPQDVVVGILLCCCVLYLNARVLAWLEQHEKADIWIALVGILLALGLVAYISLKSYPMVYVDGKLLVDPALMIRDGFRSSGSMVGFFAGWFLERRYIQMKVDGTVAARIVRFLVGAVLVFLLLRQLPMPSGLTENAQAWLRAMLVCFFVTAGYPAMLVGKRCFMRRLQG